mmetsp:Transcript_22699/g.35012  ORF Transcript_22699/g.35012 Transcript_22699/m.35012 type:complete len:315 (-) Transcript_22699:984-1928(-)|eukprot:CAMPEP_0195290914 /NCGR_PEP_ID=MMETSP0707-20130614/6586_1 /TAXON_ID=33640 /ORGANISM="Asterionellopsis glacialis, Strain CCMP134" /LENGTH=314 /DNA_ID=CAMNT_0040351097 /DNA_START=111 /DNA_END=1055 /DNA_ORIENTATION=-
MKKNVVISFLFVRLNCVSGSFIPQTSHPSLSKTNFVCLLDQKENSLGVTTKDAIFDSTVSSSSARKEEQLPLSMSTNLIFRRMEEMDISDLVRMYVREYSPSLASQSLQFTLFPRKWMFQTKYKHNNMEQVANLVDNFVLATIIYLGLYQRFLRRWISEPDHQVWCLTASADDTNDSSDVVVGAVELSFEVPGQTSSPFCVPMEVKNKLLRGHASNDCLQPYISNVIVKEDFRGQGYGLVMLEEIEKEAMNLGNDFVTLHVNTNSQTARSLYHKLGYELLDTQTGSGLASRFIRFLAGLYFMEESELLYMKKEL